MIFVDTEFISHSFPFFQDAELLSAGIVTAKGRELYLEVHDTAVHARATDFVREQVLPQFGMWSGAVVVGDCVAAGHRFADFLAQEQGTLHLCSDFAGDLHLLVDAIKRAGRSDGLFDRMRCSVLHSLDTESLEPLWIEEFTRQETSTGLLRHHALLDARVLKAVYDRTMAAGQL